MEKFKNLFLLILSLGFGLLLTELLLNAFNQPRFYKSHTAPAQFVFIKINNGDLSYLNTPAERIRFIYDGNPRGYFGKNNEVDHVTNSAGFRGGEFLTAKAPGTFRIAFLGDSFTFGEGVNFCDTYPEQVSLILNEKFASLPLKFESYNFGVGGYNTAQELFLLENTVLKVNPDAVVLKYDASDAEPPLYKIDAATQKPVRIPRWYENPQQQLLRSQPPDQPIYKLRLPRILWQLTNNHKQNKIMVGYYKSLFTEASPGWKESRQALRRIITLCRQHNIPCYVVYFPVLYKLNHKYPFKEMHAMVRKETEGAGAAAFIDLFPRLKNRNAADLWVHPSDHHPNEIVDRIAAQAITQKMLEDKNTLKKINALASNN